MTHESESILEKAALILDKRTPELDSADLTRHVANILDRKDIFLRIREQCGSPLYIIDEDSLIARARLFTAAFESALPGTHVYFAMKSNNHPLIARILTDLGLGLDVSSGLELEVALGTGCKDIIFSGPGKSAEELDLAVKNAQCVTILMDSFAELERLQAAASAAGVKVRAGIRVATKESGIWRKFGISLTELPRFIEASKGCSSVDLRGLQFHVSWNLDPRGYVWFLRSLGAQLAELGSKRLAGLEFIDIGGGFWPRHGEWLVETATPEGALRNAVSPKLPDPLRHFKHQSFSIEQFASDISAAVRQNIFPHINCRICTEPGRWLCNDAMHILMTVIDKKADDLVITDAGINAVGWERYENDYFPVINLSRPADSEHPCMVMGSLCTPHDIWGYAYHGSGIENGDALLVPSQGAYTYSLRQEFIKPLPSVAHMKSSGGKLTITRVR